MKPSFNSETIDNYIEEIVLAVNSAGPVSAEELSSFKISLKLQLSKTVAAAIISNLTKEEQDEFLRSINNSHDGEGVIKYLVDKASDQEPKVLESLESFKSDFLKTFRSKLEKNSG